VLRIRDPVLFYPLDPGWIFSGSRIFLTTTKTKTIDNALPVLECLNRGFFQYTLRWIECLNSVSYRYTLRWIVLK
jgi:hypothetical protein